MTFKAAKCPNCAGDIQVPDDKDAVKCMYCGSDIIVREAIKAAGGVNVENLLKLAKNAESSGNNEEAYKHYSKVLEYDQYNVKAWIGRGITKENTALFCFNNALEFAQNKDELRSELISTLEGKINCITSTGGAARSNIDYLDALMALDSTNPKGLVADAALILGGVVTNRNKLREKLREIGENESKRAQATNKSEWVTYAQVATKNAYSQYKIEKALELFDRALVVSRNSSDIKELISKVTSYYLSELNRCKEGDSFASFYYECPEQIVFPLLRCYEKVANTEDIIEFKKRTVTSIFFYKQRALDIITKNKEKYYKDLLSNFIEVERTRMANDLISELRQVDKSYVPPSLKGGGGCFIATAAYGSPLASEVILLREFRDRFLETQPLGKLLVKIYYFISPAIARVIEKNTVFRTITRQSLRPIVFVVKGIMGKER